MAEVTARPMRPIGLRPSYAIILIAVLTILSVSVNSRNAETSSPLFVSESLLYWALFVVPLVVFAYAIWGYGSRALLGPSGLPNLVVFMTGALAGWLNFRPSNPVQYLAMGRPVLDGVDNLLILVSASFAIGSLVRFRRVPQAPSPGVRQDYVLLRRLGRWALVIALLQASYSFVTSSVDLRGVGQLDRGLDSSIYVGVGILRAVGTLALLTPSPWNQKWVQRWYDWVLILGPGILLATIGSRSVLATTLMIVLAIALARGKVNVWKVLVAIPILYLSFATILVYRSARPWSDVFDLESVYQDTAGVVWTSVALTYTNVPDVYDFQLGGTYLVGVVFLLTGPVARMLLGDALTGAAAYRDLLNFGNPNHGLGFSVPAEAWLNFGAFGITLIPFLVAAVMALLWSWSDIRVLTPKTSLYVLLFAQFLTLWRSDSVAMFKLPVYSAIALALFAALVRIKPGPQYSASGLAEIPTGATPQLTGTHSVQRL